MKKLFIAAVAVFGLLAVPSNAAAVQKRTSDKPKKVVVDSNLSKGYIEVTVYADKPTK